MPRPTRRDLLKTGVVTLGLGLTPPIHATEPVPLESFHFDHILGTSLDVWTSAGMAARVEPIVLQTIERLRATFSTYDPTSELSELNRTPGTRPVSDDLFAVLAEYAIWQPRTSGACSAEVGELMQLWQQAEQAGREPDTQTLNEVVERLRQPNWSLDTVQRAVTRTRPSPLVLNSIAKGYILDQVDQAVRRACPEATSLLLNLGGDMLIRGDAQVIGVQNPHHRSENAPPLTCLRLENQAIATSGGYQRSYQLKGQHLSHLIDPRTGRPADHIASATVVAPSSTLANTLATTLCILTPLEGLALIERTPGTACLLITAQGQQIRSEQFADLELPTPIPVPVALLTAEEKADAWPEGRQVSIALELPRPRTGRAIRRPYVAIWIEDAEGKSVRTITVWGTSRKYLPTLTTWWKVARADQGLVKTVTRATRAAGKYELTWDGKDDAGKPVPQGSYTVKVEVHREHGKHLTQSGKIDCKGEDARATLDANDETGATLIQYATKK